MNAPVSIPPRPTTAGLLADQAAATALWVAAVRQFRAATDTLHLPLGSPVAGVDRADIDATLAEWERDMVDPVTLEWCAADLVAEYRQGVGQTAHDARRGLG
jgi:hypothetical protein